MHVAKFIVVVALFWASAFVWSSQTSPLSTASSVLYAHSKKSDKDLDRKLKAVLRAAGFTGDIEQTFQERIEDNLGRPLTRMWPHADTVVPVDWVATSPVRVAFSERVLNRSVRQMGDYWVRQSVTQGITPPSTQRSTRAVLRFVASVPGAISYVPSGEEDDSVAVVQVKDLR